jgi:hypothetical protein
MRKYILFTLLFVTTTGLAAPPKPYHIELEANPAAPFPFLSKFGTVTLHVYPGGVRAETFWLNGFSRNGTSTVTVENPLARMYTDVPVAQISGILRRMATLEPDVVNATPSVAPVISGNVRGIGARRHRLMYGPEAWIDVWTTTAVPETPQLRSIIQQLVRGISPGTAGVVQSIEGTPLYVELNFRRYKKLPLLRTKSFARTNAGEEAALKVGTLYFRAPLLDAIWK